jgi:large subunit ribosomal protein L3
MDGLRYQIKNPPLIGKKIGMTQIFNTEGLCLPVTIIKIMPSIVTQTKNYSHCSLVQIGFNTKEKFRLNKPEYGHLLKYGLPKLEKVREFKVHDVQNYSIGDVIGLNRLKVNDLVNIQGKTIGKGFSGPIKRHGFARGPESHGSKHHRAQGSLGAGTDPGRVFPGKKMAGRMGGGITTILKLKVVDIDLINNLLIVKGAVPGKKGNLLTIKYGDVVGGRNREYAF